MKQIKDLGDDRNKGWCVFCGGPGETRDHVPSRVLLDEPFPTELPVVPACSECNASFSADEAYLTCLIECALVGSIETAKRRKKVGELLARSPALASRLQAARYQGVQESGFTPEHNRVRSILVKLARGHAAFENNESRTDSPRSVAFMPFVATSTEHRSRFEIGSNGLEFAGWPEVGSRAMTRLVTGADLSGGGWIVVQPEMYRYRIEWREGFRVQMVIREYLAAEVAWD